MARGLETGGELIHSINPTTGEPIAAVRQATADDYERVMTASSEAFRAWRTWPAPKRGEVVRPAGRGAAPATRTRCERPGDAGDGQDPEQKAMGEVQEMIDMADLAVGMSRQLYGLSMHSERPQHRMYEQWHPLGPVGVITAFNFPVAVWAWNSTVAADLRRLRWSGSRRRKPPLTAVAVTRTSPPG